MKPANEVLTSFKNPKIQFVRDLISQRSARDESGLFVAEGVRLAGEALRRHIQPRSLFFSSHLSPRGEQLVSSLRGADVEVTEVSPEVLDRLSDTETSQGILLVLPQDMILVSGNAEPVLIVDQVRDPGNMGTLLRSAAAVGVGMVFLSPGSVDPFMPKVVRAGMGAHFHLPIRQASWAEIHTHCKQHFDPPLQVLLAEAEAGISMWQTDLTRPLALIIGGEAEGAGEQARKLADDLVHIPMPGAFESLNVGVAATLMLYEMLRQRRS